MKLSGLLFITGSLAIAVACGNPTRSAIESDGGYNDADVGKNQDAASRDAATTDALMSKDGASCDVTCSSLGKQCGVVAAQECDGALVDCGGCTLGSACNADGQCVVGEPVEGDVTGQIALVTRHDYYGGTFCKPFAASMTNALFFPAQPAIPDTRAVVDLGDGDSCIVGSRTYSAAAETLEYLPLYPENVGDYWPNPEYKNVGRLVLSPDGAPGTIELDPFPSGGGANGFAYAKKDVPADLMDGATTCSSLFDVSYAPLGQVFSVQAQGSDDFAATDLGHGTMPTEFQVTSPDLANENASIYFQNDTTFSWTGSTKQGQMILIVDDLFYNEIVCTLKDDGSVTLPASLMQQLGNAPSYLIKMTRREPRLNRRVIGDTNFFVDTGGMFQVFGDVKNTPPASPR